MESAVLAEMAGKMRVKDDDDDRTVLSKKLSYVLRHGAAQLELPIREGGFIPMNDLLACEPLFGGVELQVLLEVVEQSNHEKQRYELLEQEGEWLIRATCKHTMQGLAPGPARDKKGRRAGREVRGSAGGDRARRAAPVTEDDFCARWRLDRLARARFQELPAATRLQVMERFNPGAQVPESDFPKVFVAFCKRFRARGKEDGGWNMVDADRQEAESSSHPSSPLGSSGPRSKKKGGKRRGGEEEVAEADHTSPSAYLSDHEEPGEPYETFRSPGSTPRSLSGGFGGGLSPQAVVPPLSPHPTFASGSPMSSPSRPFSAVPPAPQVSPRLRSAQLRPPMGPPPPMYAPQGVGVQRTPGNTPAPLLTLAPPPLPHVMQVPVIGMGNMCCGGYQDASNSPSHSWNLQRVVAHGAYPEAGDRARPMYHDNIDYSRGRGQFAPPPNQMGYSPELHSPFGGVAGGGAPGVFPRSPLAAAEYVREEPVGYRGGAMVAPGWVQTGACY